MLSDIGVQARIVRKNLVEIEGGPIRWAEIVIGDERSYVVYRVPDSRLASRDVRIHLHTMRRKDFPLAGHVIDLSWSTDDNTPWRWTPRWMTKSWWKSRMQMPSSALESSPRPAETLRATLMSDESLRHTIMNMKNGDIDIRSSSRLACWELKTELPELPGEPGYKSPSAPGPAEVWLRYQTLAKHLQALSLN